MNRWFHSPPLVGMASYLAACGGDDHSPATRGVAQTETRSSNLVEAVDAAGLADTLNGPGPLTVFALTTDAFAALLAEPGISKAALTVDATLAIADQRVPAPTSWPTTASST